ncbi:uncharacterized protein TNCV_2575931 [Trichonephila clavipes]|uniref:Uncharacterized protein n=1 Tax=Trichonephila clavipes TaxID=2585209 RepID=A0A8X6R5P9_TRICX|nr:uncharacterized protein TNCV_2575931 [Trichonephila clavipes]
MKIMIEYWVANIGSLRSTACPDNAHSVAFSQRSSIPRLTEDEIFNDSDINNLMDYEDGQEEPDSLRVDKNMRASNFRRNWKSIFLKKIPIKKGV